MRIIFIIIGLLLAGSNPHFAQCSDAGVCIIGSGHAEFEHQIQTSYVFGKSGKADDLTVHSLQLEGSFQLFRDSRITVLLPWGNISGPLGSASGIGDFTLLWNQIVLDRTEGQFSVQIGGKFATGDANSAHLPQAYQTGLGVNDILFGFSYETDPFLFALGYQVSRERSNNSITRLKRGDDFLARIGYSTHFDNFIIGFEILSIKRIQESSVLDTSVIGGSSFINISGSDQFQVNLLSTAVLPLSDRYRLRGLVAVPLRSRSVNVDGLTRSLTLSVGIQYAL